MENHPIPQDVTGFQFKLIGDMTIKQFAYVATGVILAWVTFTILPLPGILKLPIAAGVAGFGLALAFLPYEGRPLDIMVLNFVKAFFTPNQYLYHKQGGHLAVAVAHWQKKQLKMNDQQTQINSAAQLQKYLQTLHHSSNNKLDEKENVYFQSLSSLYANQAPPQPQMAIPQPHVLTPEEIAEKQQKGKETEAQAQETQQPEQIQQQSAQEGENKEQLEKEAQMIRQELEEAKKQEEQAGKDSAAAAQAHEKVLDLEKELQTTLAQKEQLEKELLALQRKLEEQKQKVYTPSVAQPKEETQHVKKIPKQMAPSVGAPLVGDTPNLIIGVIKDPRGNVLPNILVEVKDAEGNPVRAFKTNPLGQFASATPLVNGTYTVEFEDPKGEQKFDTVEIVVNGEIMLPLEIISTDAREELRKELFIQ